MKQRCDNPLHERYKDYGGRGISYDLRWKLFEAFLSDMGDPPGPFYHIGRKDHDKSYCLDNCEWMPGRKNSGQQRWKCY